MGYLDDHRIAAYCDRSMTLAKTSLPGPITALFYDTTTLSFASDTEVFFEGWADPYFTGVSAVTCLRSRNN